MEKMEKIKVIRCSKDFAIIVDYIRAQHLIRGKKPPALYKITSAIAKKIDKEELLRNEFILI